MANSDYLFIDFDGLFETVNEVYQKEGKNLIECCEDFGGIEDFCMESALATSSRLARDFKKYCNSKDTSIPGNFNDVTRDYEREHEGKKFSDILAKLNAAVDDEETRNFKDWAVGWFFDTFGTYNLGYNFSDTLTNFYWDEIQEFEDRKDAEEKGLVYDPTCKQLELAI